MRSPAAPPISTSCPSLPRIVSAPPVVRAVVSTLRTDAEHHLGVVAECDVVAGSAGDRVACRAADEDIVVLVTGERIDAAGGGIDAFGRRQGAAAVEDARAVAEDDVVARVARDGVARRAADEQVGRVIALDDVAAAEVGCVARTSSTVARLPSPL